MSDNLGRYRSLDVFRGADILLMIVVNSLGSYETAYSPLLHADWHGFTLTDLVFPTFLFIVGCSLAFSLPRYQTLGHRAVVGKIAKRTALIFLVGVVLGWFPFLRMSVTGEISYKELDAIRIFGVLQRIALAYGVAALIIHFFRWHLQVVAAAAALVVYAIILGVGGLSLEDNAVLRVDRWLVGDRHLYQGEGIPFDPEGLLSTLPAIVNVIAGYWAIRLLQRTGNGLRDLAFLMVASALCLVAAFAWELFLPFNKKLWTSSYVLLTIGIDGLALGVLVYFLDHRPTPRWVSFFEIPGRNPLAIYVLSGLLVKMLLFIKIRGTSLYGSVFQQGFASWAGPYHGSALFGVAVMMVCWCAAWWLDRKHIYLRL